MKTISNYVRPYVVILGITLTLLFNCQTDKYQKSTVETSQLAMATTEHPMGPVLFPRTEGQTQIDSLYETSFYLEDLGNNDYNIIVYMGLKEQSYYASPNSSHTYKGRFMFDVETNDKIQLFDALSETSILKEDIEPHCNGYGANWIRQNTFYKQPFHLNTSEDFYIMGFIQFTIEPRSTKEVIPFGITNKDGNLKIAITKC
ncbi:hypothetical protein [Mangrovimonas sp. DI 80]|uniref:hypothetical protein n=1 Tax=Mangrovimonas sp. DI 80 TaxID=1779330 RepID=UPI0009772DF4|nr:hypothetical protein [Mangrovimonas sp. DI 80]OMP30741.1 hypothetical protein BKM32_10920 [Mangrovimonas sp. DI 80]